ncbi:MAG: thiamine-phosphate kinase [Rhodospirillaceae bacterium]|nr:thiamine-phosphate kinase [Rhodospirillaceae bacterium]
MPGLTEFELIGTLLKPLAAQSGGAFSLSDDAAFLPDPPSGYGHVVTKDALAVGIHMRAADPPGDMARKALRVNLSDLAAMGARPVGFFMALCLGPETDESYLRSFVEGLSDDVEAFNIPLMGGDIIRQQGPFVVSITAIGAVPKDDLLRRSGAQPGDGLWVSGTIGDGALGLLVAEGQGPDLFEADTSGLIKRYRIPEPRLALGIGLVGIANACIDVSDGLISDVGHLCAASSVGCSIAASSVPLSPMAREALKNEWQLMSTVLTGGDDYELAFAAPQQAEKDIKALSAEVGIPATCIGSFEAGEGLSVVDHSGKAMNFASTGYRHA